LPFTASVGTVLHTILARRNLDKRLRCIRIAHSIRILKNERVAHLEITETEPETLGHLLFLPSDTRISYQADILKVILFLFKTLEI
jgi:hypothetical protein